MVKSLKVGIDFGFLWPCISLVTYGAAIGCTHHYGKSFMFDFSIFLLLIRDLCLCLHAAGMGVWCVCECVSVDN